MPDPKETKKFKFGENEIELQVFDDRITIYSNGYLVFEPLAGNAITIKARAIK